MRKKKGLLDFCCTVLTCVAVYSQTPVGGLLDRGVSWVFGLERKHPPLTSFFDLEAAEEEGPSDHEVQTLIAARQEEDSELVAQATAHKIPYDLLHAIDLAGGTTGIQLSDDQWSAAQALLNGRLLPGGRNDRQAINLAAAILIEHKSRTLGSADAGLESFLIGDEPVSRAITIARDRQSGDATLLRVHGRYLTRTQREEVEPFVNQVMGIRKGLTFVWPIEDGKYRVTSRFGERTDPILGTRSFHNGIDLGVRVGTPVRAAHDGTVRYASYDGVNGHFVKLNHGYGLTTAYCHNDELKVSRAQEATRSQTIALSGNSGRSTGPHLHYIVRIGRKAVDPTLFAPPTIANSHPVR